jgi:hypothetical protein
VPAVTAAVERTSAPNQALNRTRVDWLRLMPPPRGGAGFVGCTSNAWSLVPTATNANRRKHDAEREERGEREHRACPASLWPRGRPAFARAERLLDHLSELT